MDAAGIAAVEEVLATTRAVRRRLDLTRPVPDEVILRCIDLAEQAPTGGDVASRRWLVLRDPAVKKAFADIYREAGGNAIVEGAARLAGTGHPKEKVMASGAFLAEHLEEVPALVLVTIWGAHDGSGNPGLFDSVVQAAWSFCLAARAHGLGTAWTSLHLSRKADVAELLGIPDGVTQIVLFPVAFTQGTDFKRARRRPAAEITYLDRWGHTAERPSTDGLTHLADGAGVTVEVDVAAGPRKLWALISDPTVPARFSEELRSVEWLDGATGPAVGARFRGHNEMANFGAWSTECTITACDPERRFAWVVGDPADPAASWSFELDMLGPWRTRLRQHVTIGERGSGTASMIHAEPEREQRVLGWRRKALRRAMQTTVEGIRDLAEAPSDRSAGA